MASDIIARSMAKKSNGDVNQLAEQFNFHTNNEDIHVTTTDKNKWNIAAESGYAVTGDSSYALNNAVEYPIIDFKIYGNSTQNKYSGKNLFDFISWENSVATVNNGIIGVFENTMQLIANNDNCSVESSKTIAVKPNTTYTFSWKSDNNNEGLIDIFIHNDDGTIGTAGGDNKYEKSVTFTTDEHSIDIEVSFGVSNSGESITYSNIQLELGDTATSYEPYVGGIPAPNPNYPQDIVSVGDNGFDIIAKDDTHFNLLSVKDSGGDIITKQPCSMAAKVGETVAFTVAASGSGLTYQWKYSRDNGTTWKNGYGGGTGVTPTYSFKAGTSDNGLQYKCVITDANGVKTETNIAKLYIVSADCEITTASIAPDALPFCGIPVESGGNYTDSNGQQWICDELIYNADGSGKIIKRTEKIKLSSNNMNSYHTNEKRAVYSIQQHIVSGNSISYTKCNRLIPAHGGGFSYETGGKYYINNQLLFVYIQNFGVETESDWKNYVDNNDVIVYHAVKTPTIIELTAAEVDALRTLQTFDGATNIYNNGDADMSVKYCTNKALSEFVLPIFNGLQSQIDELRAAVLSLGGNV